MTAVFFSYSHKDEALRDKLETHLSMLKRQGVITTWHDRRLDAGDDLDSGISRNLETADIILLLVSADFLASEYCYSKEMLRAIERHEAGKARVIPVILRPCDWQSAPFGKLVATPPDGKPVTKWTDQDEAFLEIIRAIKAAAEKLQKPSAQPAPTKTVATQPNIQRSSNLRIRKEFSERDKDRFLDEAFEFMSRFFENSLEELQKRNPEIECSFKRIDSSRFTAIVYRDGRATARCQIRTGTMMGGITFSYNADLNDNSINESLSVEADDQSLYLKALGMGLLSHHSDKLSEEGAAEYYWSLFVDTLQR